MSIGSSDLEWSWAQNFLADLQTTIVWFDIEWPNLVRGDKHNPRGQTCPHPTGAGPQRPQFFGTAYLLQKGLTYCDEIWYGNVWDTSVFVSVQPRPISTGRCPSVLIIFGPPSYDRTVWRTTTKFGVMTHVGSSVMGCQPRPHPKVWRPIKRPPNIWKLTLWETTTKFCMMINCEARSTTNADARSACNFRVSYKYLVYFRCRRGRLSHRDAAGQRQDEPRPVGQVRRQQADTGFHQV